VKALPASRHLLFWSLSIVILAIDLVSKSLVFERLGFPRRSTRWLIDGWVQFRLCTTMNEGALWGMGQGLTWLFASLSVVAFVGVLWWLFVCGAAHSLWLTLSLSLITGGTLGNLYDRLGLHGCVNRETGQVWKAVRDFLDFRFGGFEWAIFNCADAFLMTGAGMLVVESFRSDGGVKPAAEAILPDGDLSGASPVSLAGSEEA